MGRPSTPPYVPVVFWQYTYFFTIPESNFYYDSENKFYNKAFSRSRVASSNFLFLQYTLAILINYLVQHQEGRKEGSVFHLSSWILVKISCNLTQPNDSSLTNI